MNWHIHSDGCYVSSSPGHSFELGEWKHGTWLLKHWTSGVVGSTWYEVESLGDAFAMVANLMSDRPTITKEKDNA